jgi:hypothetical protein
LSNPNVFKNFALRPPIQPPASETFVFTQGERRAFKRNDPLGFVPGGSFFACLLGIMLGIDFI